MALTVKPALIYNPVFAANHFPVPTITLPSESSLFSLQSAPSGLVSAVSSAPTSLVARGPVKIGAENAASVGAQIHLDESVDVASGFRFLDDHITGVGVDLSQELRNVGFETRPERVVLSFDFFERLEEFSEEAITKLAKTVHDSLSRLNARLSAGETVSQDEILAMEKLLSAQLGVLQRQGEILYWCGRHTEQTVIRSLFHDHYATPLTSMSGYLEFGFDMLKEAIPVPASVIKFFEKMSRDDESVLAEDALDKAQVTASPVFKARGVHLEKSATLGSLKFQNRNQFRDLRKIVTNLLTNAARYSDQNKDEMNRRAILHIETLSDGSRMITVSDTGIGILDENLARLGEDDFREGRAQIDGHGFGLSAILKILARQGWGSLWVRSFVGEGTDFRFVIPASAFEGQNAIITSSWDFTIDGFTPIRK